MRRRQEPEGITEPNMTPLIDVSLVLVVILLVATPLAFQSGITVSRAGVSARQAEPVRSERIEISVLADDRIEVNGRPVAADALGAAIEPLIERSATRQVIVRCADDVSHGAFVAVLDQARTSGAAAVAVAAGVTP